MSNYTHREFIPIRPNQIWRDKWLNDNSLVIVLGVLVPAIGFTVVRYRDIETRTICQATSGNFYTRYDIDFPDNDLYMSLDLQR